MDVEMISQGSGEKPAGGLLALLRTGGPDSSTGWGRRLGRIAAPSGPAQAFPASPFGTLRDLGAITICGPGSH